MATRATLRTAVRAELNDGGTTQLWSDALLNEWLAEAIRDYGRRLPKWSTFFRFLPTSACRLP